jgi:hypothetical protein
VKSTRPLIFCSSSQIDSPSSLFTLAVKSTRHSHYVFLRLDFPAALTCFRATHSSSGQVHPPCSLCALAVKSTCHTHFLFQQSNPPATLTLSAAVKSTCRAYYFFRG